MSWILINPILTKELRVLSRRKGTYGVRCAYVLGLATMLWVVWYLTVGAPNLAEYARAHWMHMVARQVTSTLMWILFLGSQLLAIILLSGSLSEEIRRSRLEVLRTTPLSHLQIVSGKLLSRFFQLVYLLSLSLPILAIIRIWGGISTAYLLQSLGVIAMTTLVAASLSAWLSILCHYPGRVIQIAFTILAVVYGLQVLGELFPFIQTQLLTIHPYFIMQLLNQSLTNPGANMAIPWNWPYFYGILGLVVVVLNLLTVTCLYFIPPSVPKLSASRRGQAKIKSLHRSGARLVSWLDQNSWWRIGLQQLGILLCLAGPMGLLFVVGTRGQWRTGILRIREVCIPVLYLILVIRILSTTADSIGMEKERRTWTGLLQTPLSNGQILRGKVWAILAHNVTGWLVLVGTLVAFNATMGRVGRFMNPSLNQWRLALAIVQMLGYASFALGAGFYFAIRLNSSLKALLAGLGAIVASYMLYQYGLQPWFSRVLLPMLSGGGDQSATIRTVFIFAFCVAGLQGAVGLLLLFTAQWQLRKNQLS